jgi:phytoene desaturase
MTKPTVTIVGAGIGGLGTAIHLARKGFQVTIFEKNAQPGGRCQRIVKEGHIFDTGPTMYIFPDLYKNFFASIGEDINKYVKLIKTDPTYRLHFPDMTHLTLTPDFAVLREQFEKREKGSFDNFLRFLKAAKTHYTVAIEDIITKDFVKLFDYFNLSNVYKLLRSNAIMPHYLYTRQFFRHPYLRAAFTFQDSYLGLNPMQAPSIYSLFAYTEFIHGSYLPQGGMYEIILALEKIAKKNGVRIHYHSPITKIIISHTHATGVLLENQQIKNADYVVVNSDLSYSYTNLLPKDSYAKKLLKKPHSCSAIVFHWGLDTLYPQIQTHNLFFSESYKRGFDDVINKKNPPSQPHFYIQAPTRTDPTRAPRNHDTLSVMIPTNRIYPQHSINWNSYKNHVRRYIIERLQKIGISHIDRHITFEESYLPHDWQTHLNLMYGSVYGLHHNLAQLGYLRPHRRHAKFKNVFFVGASNHPGSGLPTVLRSAQFTSKRIIEEL